MPDQMTDPLDVWRLTFEEIPDEKGQLQIYIGPNELEQVATLAQVEQQVHDEANRER